MIKLPEKKYKVIYADPPWKYCNKTPEECKHSKFREVERYYSTMNTKDIANLPIKELADDDCVLFMWATYPKLKDSFKVITKWGFNYKTVAFTWVKLNRNGSPFFGMGQWTRSNAEICLLATKGEPKREDATIPQAILSRIGEHSAKPHEIYARIEKLMGDLPRIELFARCKRTGWDTWGNQVPKEKQALIQEIVITGKKKVILKQERLLS